MRIDLHTHSSASDGTDAPAQMPRLAQAAGLQVLGLTVHDTVAGWDAAASSARKVGVTLVRGIEMTTVFPVDPQQHPNGRSRVSVHLLGYLFDPEAPQMRAHMEAMQNGREQRAREMVDRLAVDFPITWEMVQEHRDPGAPLGRPHIADTLVALGVAEKRSDIFATVLSSHSPYYVPNRSPLTTDAIAWVRAAGGKAVVAHPKGLARGNYLPDSAIRELAAAGLFGLEVNHRDNPEAERPALAALAQELGLAQFGASDYHGEGKPNRLGEYTTSEQVLAALRAGAYLDFVAP